MARNILCDRRRKLVAAGILAQQDAAGGTADQEYVPTPQGEGLFTLLVALRQWGERHLFAPGERHSRSIERRSGMPVAPLRGRAQDGSPLPAAATEVLKLS